MLAAIRERLAASAPFDAVRREHAEHPAVAPREDRAQAVAETPPRSLTELFVRALEAVSGHCDRLSAIFSWGDRRMFTVLPTHSIERRAGGQTLANSR